MSYFLHMIFLLFSSYFGEQSLYAQIQSHQITKYIEEMSTENIKQCKNLKNFDVFVIRYSISIIIWLVINYQQFYDMSYFLHMIFLLFSSYFGEQSLYAQIQSHQITKYIEEMSTENIKQCKNLKNSDVFVSFMNWNVQKIEIEIFLERKRIQVCWKHYK